MYSFLKHLHSGWAYVVVLLSLIYLIALSYHFFTKKPVHKGLKKVSFFTTLSFHLQFLIGIGLYMVSPKIKGAWESGMVMKDSFFRLLSVEHPLMMFTAVILITIANVKLKKNPYIKPSTLVFAALAIVCFYMIPWAQWLHL